MVTSFGREAGAVEPDARALTRPPRPGTVTSTPALALGRMHHSAAALRWLTTAPVPQASTAARTGESRARRG